MYRNVPDLYTTDQMALDAVTPNHSVDPYDQASIEKVYVYRDLPSPLPSMSRALLCTRDEVDIPATKLGFIQLRSTFARLGLISPPTVADPGFHGQLTMEVFNASKSAIIIPPYVAIWSMHLVAVDEPLYRGRYQGQTGIQLPKALTRD